jgi:hypothetical protein
MSYDPQNYNFGLVPSTMGASNPSAAYTQKMATPSANGGMKSPVAGAGGGPLGMNLDTASLALGGLQSLGNLWQAWEANKLAKEQFKVSTGFANTNLANSIQSYNTQIEDRSRARAFTEGQTPEQAQAYVDKNRLPAKSF